MCRFFALAGLNVSRDFLAVLARSFTLSSLHDPYLAELSGGKYVSHGDGWGLAAVGVVRGELTVAHHKSLEPIFNHSSQRVLDLFLDRVSSYEQLYLVLHARRASLREPYGLEYVHPYMRLSESGVAWFVHNGGANKKALAEKLGVYPWIRVDSELLGHYVMDHVLSCAESGVDVDTCVVEAYTEAKGYVVSNSALNSALLVLHRDTPRLYVTFWVREPRTPRVVDYYTLLARERVNGGETTLICSKSTGEYLLHFSPGDLHPLEPGVYSVGPGSIKRLAEL